MTKNAVWAVAALGLALATGGAWWVQQRGAAGAGSATAATPGAESGAASAAGAGKAAVPQAQVPPGRAVLAQVPQDGRPRWCAACAGVEVAKVAVTSLQDDARRRWARSNRAQSVMLRPEVAGRVVADAFADGARVRKGGAGAAGRCAAKAELGGRRPRCRWPAPATQTRSWWRRTGPPRAGQKAQPTC